MAARRRQSKASQEVPQETFVSEYSPTPAAEVVDRHSPRLNWLSWLGILVALLCLYWWKTNTWPVVALVGTQPIFRSQVNAELYAQGGKTVVDSLVTEKLVQNELAKNHVQVSDTEVNGKIAEIKKGFGSDADFQSALDSRGMNLTDLKKQIALQVGIEKLLSDRVSVSASETATFIKQMGSTLTSTTAADRQKEAESMLKDQKLQQEINVWIEDVRAKGKVWWIGKV